MVSRGGILGIYEEEELERKRKWKKGNLPNFVDREGERGPSGF